MGIKSVFIDVKVTHKTEILRRENRMLMTTSRSSFVFCFFFISHLPFLTALNNFSHNSTFANGFAILFTYGRTAASLEVELFFESLSDIFLIFGLNILGVSAFFKRFIFELISNVVVDFVFCCFVSPFWNRLKNTPTI